MTCKIDSNKHCHVAARRYGESEGPSQQRRPAAVGRAAHETSPEHVEKAERRRNASAPLAYDVFGGAITRGATVWPSLILTGGFMIT
jgi:hypothetical protein